jgi:hypothetical protein
MMWQSARILVQERRAQVIEIDAIMNNLLVFSPEMV